VAFFHPTIFHTTPTTKQMLFLRMVITTMPLAVAVPVAASARQRRTQEAQIMANQDYQKHYLVRAFSMA
jgi:hypothetical protein